MVENNITGIKKREFRCSRKRTYNYESVEISEGFEVDDTIKFEDFRQMCDSVEERVNKLTDAEIDRIKRDTEQAKQQQQKLTEKGPLHSMIKPRGN